MARRGRANDLAQGHARTGQQSMNIPLTVPWTEVLLGALALLPAALT
jgi:hypothetical protein